VTTNSLTRPQRLRFGAIFLQIVFVIVVFLDFDSLGDGLNFFPWFIEEESNLSELEFKDFVFSADVDEFLDVVSLGSLRHIDQF
jgi:hypothetical protein